MPVALEDVIEWDIPNWSVALDYWRQHTAQGLASLKALEIGSRHGGLSLWVALSGMEVLCTDVHGPSSEAVRKHQRYNVSSRVRYEAVNALEIPYAGAFDVVLFKSVLGGIGRGDSRENQAKAIREMHRALKTGGEL